MTRRGITGGRPAPRAGRRPPPGHQPPPAHRRSCGQEGVLAIEWVLTLPLVAALVSGLVVVGSVVRDVLVLEEAARTAARAAAVSTDDAVVRAVARDAAPELAHLEVSIAPGARRAGQHVAVTTAVTVRHGPFERRLTARSTALVEPVADGTAPAGFPTTGWRRGPQGTHGGAAGGGPQDPWRAGTRGSGP